MSQEQTFCRSYNSSPYVDKCRQLTYSQSPEITNNSNYMINKYNLNSSNQNPIIYNKGDNIYHSQSLTEHIKNLIENETQLKKQLNEKNKEICDLKKEITKSKEKEEELKSYITEQTKIINQLENNNTELNKNLNDSENYRQDIDNQRIQLMKESAILKEENRMQNEKILNQLQTINKIQKTLDIMNELKSENEKLKKKMEDLIKCNQSLNFDVNTLKEELETEHKENEELKKDMNNNGNELIELKQKFNELKNMNLKLSDKITKLTKENSNIKNEKNITDKDNQNKTLQYCQIESQNVNLKNCISNIINYINDDLINFERWMETYFPMQFQDKIKLPEIQTSTQNLNEQLSQYNFKNINIDNFTQKIYQIKTLIDNICNKKANELKSFKNEFSNIQKENIIILKFLENLLSNIKYEIEANNYFKLSNTNISSNELKYDYLISEIENLLTKVFTLLLNWKNYPMLQDTIESLQNDNKRLNNELYSLEQTLEIKDQGIQSIQQENIDLKKQFCFLDQLKLDNIKLNEQLNEQHNLQCENIKYAETINALECDKDNLIKDNVILIKENDTLKRQLYEINSRLNFNNNNTIVPPFNNNDNTNNQNEQTNNKYIQ